MLVEFFLATQATLNCDVTKAAMGKCGECRSDPGSFSLCETRTSTKPGSTATYPSPSPKPKPMRSCSYYANNTIDTPTLTVITSWVEVGSRLCIGDEVPKKKVYPSITEQLEDIFSASIANPLAQYFGPRHPEPFEDFVVSVDSETQQVSGELFDNPAVIRFRAVSATWTFSDGTRSSGFSVTKNFELEGSSTAQATVGYQVDYKTGGSWVVAAASWSLSSNQLTIGVVDPPRRTVLVP